LTNHDGMGGRRSGSFVMVGLVGLLENVAALHCNILRHLYYTPNEGKLQLILVKRENAAKAKGGRKAHRAYPFTLITTSVSIITSALLSHVHPAVAVLRLRTQSSVMGLVERLASN
jgi:hypothetical protein